MWDLCEIIATSAPILIKEPVEQLNCKLREEIVLLRVDFSIAA